VLQAKAEVGFELQANAKREHQAKVELKANAKRELQAKVAFERWLRKAKVAVFCLLSSF
jgi:hypothetical protein